MVGTTLQVSGVESHNSLGSGERYRDPLRRIFNKIVHESPAIDRELALRLAIKAITDTAGPKRLVPSLLVFGTLPRFPTVNTKLPAQRERMHALQLARTEMATITSELRIRKAIMSKLPRNCDLIVRPGDQVRVCRETDKKYVGPCPVLRVDGKQLFFLTGNKEVQHSLHQILPAREFDRTVNGDQHLDILHAVLQQFTSRPSRPILHRTKSTLRKYYTQKTLVHIPQKRLLPARKRSKTSSGAARGKL